MGYVDETLLPGERVEYRARVHWWIYLTPGLWSALGLFLALGGGGALLWRLRGENPATDPEKGAWGFLVFVGLAVLAFGLYGVVRALIYDRTTELAVTTRRVVAKKGFIRRETWELQRPKLESVEVTQSLLGRMLRFGTLELQGTGGGSAPLAMIRDPLAFRRAALTETAPDPEDS